MSEGMNGLPQWVQDIEKGVKGEFSIYFGQVSKKREFKLEDLFIVLHKKLNAIFAKDIQQEATDIDYLQGELIHVLKIQFIQGYDVGSAMEDVIYSLRDDEYASESYEIKNRIKNLYLLMYNFQHIFTEMKELYQKRISKDKYLYGLDDRKKDYFSVILNYAIKHILLCYIQESLRFIDSISQFMPVSLRASFNKKLPIVDVVITTYPREECMYRNLGFVLQSTVDHSMMPIAHEGVKSRAVMMLGNDMYQSFSINPQSFLSSAERKGTVTYDCFKLEKIMCYDSGSQQNAWYQYAESNFIPDAPNSSKSVFEFAIINLKELLVYIEEDNFVEYIMNSSRVFSFQCVEQKVIANENYFSMANYGSPSMFQPSPETMMPAFGAPLGSLSSNNFGWSCNNGDNVIDSDSDNEFEDERELYSMMTMYGNNTSALTSLSAHTQFGDTNAQNMATAMRVQPNDNDAVNTSDVDLQNTFIIKGVGARSMERLVSEKEEAWNSSIERLLNTENVYLQDKLWKMVKCTTVEDLLSLDVPHVIQKEFSGVIEKGKQCSNDMLYYGIHLYVIFSSLIQDSKDDIKNIVNLLFYEKDEEGFKFLPSKMKLIHKKVAVYGSKDTVSAYIRKAYSIVGVVDCHSVTPHKKHNMSPNNDSMIGEYKASNKDTHVRYLTSEIILANHVVFELMIFSLIDMFHMRLADDFGTLSFWMNSYNALQAVLKKGHDMDAIIPVKTPKQIMSMVSSITCCVEAFKTVENKKNNPRGDGCIEDLEAKDITLQAGKKPNMLYMIACNIIKLQKACLSITQAIFLKVLSVRLDGTVSKDDYANLSNALLMDMFLSYLIYNMFSVIREYSVFARGQCSRTSITSMAENSSGIELKGKNEKHYTVLIMKIKELYECMDLEKIMQCSGIGIEGVPNKSNVSDKIQLIHNLKEISGASQGEMLQISALKQCEEKDFISTLDNVIAENSMLQFMELS